MVLNKFRARGERMLGPLADKLAAGGADRLTWASLAVAIAAGATFAMARGSWSILLVVGSLLVLANALLDALDGMVARKTGTASQAGNFLDHVIDRYADLAILAGLALSGPGDLRLGLFAITGVLLTSYMGTQAEAVGLSRDYGGLLGRADRLVLLTVIPPSQYLLGLVGVDAVLYAAGPLGSWYYVTLIGILLILLGALGHFTAVQRFVRARRALLEKEGRLAPRAPAGSAKDAPADAAPPPRAP